MKDGGKDFSHLSWEELVERGERDGGDDFPKKDGNLINGWWALCGVVKCQSCCGRERKAGVELI